MTGTLVWFEGVDFDECILDTNDISTIRGASLALLEAPRLIARLVEEENGKAGRCIFAGASQALFEADAAQLPRLEAQIDAVVGQTAPGLRDLPVEALHFVVGRAALVDGDPVGSMRRAQAAARRAQLAGAFCGPRHAERPSDRPCTIDRRRPADTTLRMPADRARDLGVDFTDDEIDADGSVAVPVSTAVKKRREWGRARRRDFYAGEVPTGWLDWAKRCSGRTENGHFVLDLQEMVEAPSFEQQLPVSLRNKIAVLYADGNGFGKILAGCRSLDDVTLFSNEALARMRKLLGSFLDRLAFVADGRDEDLPDEAAAFEERGRVPRLRFESLLYGGDEICWVFPAWMALDLVTTLFDALEGATILGQPATWSCGLVIADRKMPIADLRALAHEAADLAKISPPKGREAPPETRISIQVFESIEPPAEGLSAHRSALLGGGDDVGRFLALDATTFGDVVNWIRERKATGRLPRSQIMRILRKAHWEGIDPTEEPRRLGSVARDRADGKNADDHVALAFGDHSRRIGVDSSPPLLRDPFPEGDRTAAPALDYWIAAHLWDYVDPFAGVGR